MPEVNISIMGKGFNKVKSYKRRSKVRNWTIRKILEKQETYFGASIRTLKNTTLEKLYFELYNKRADEEFNNERPVKNRVKRKKKRYPDRLEGHNGYIYIIGNLDYNLVKIGFSKKPNSRLGSIQTGCPFKIYIIAIFSGTMRTEKDLHEKYSEYRTNGEWFSVQGKLKDSINEITGALRVAS